ncbi:MAG: apolipoprotein N-acyltransferase, partial [Jiangellaceae bacterium]
SHLARAAGAIALGAALVLAFPPHDVWFVAVLVSGAFALVVRDQPLRRSALYGVLFGLGFFVPFLPWIGLDVGPVPWLLLAALESLFFVPLALGITLVQRGPGWPVWIGAVWVAEEALRGRIPYGGFTWGNLSFSQVDGPLLPLASLGGAPFVTFAVGVGGGLLAWAVVVRRAWVRVVAVAAAAAVATSGLLVPAAAPRGDTVTVAVVQGNATRPGLDFVGRAREITNNHVEATHQLAEDVAAGSVEQPDFVIWPENSSDVSPYHDQRTYDAVDGAVRAIGVPVLLSAIVPTEDQKNVRNTSIVWDPRTGPGATYVKRHPMPFGEYIPFRSLAEKITDAVQRQPRDHLAGDEIGVLDMGAAVVGNVICFEVAFDDIVRDAVTAGGQLITVQTNNATFGFTPMTEQQLAMARLRAVEHGRAVLVAALAGVSAVVAPDGDVLDRAELFTQDVMVDDLRLSDATTLATELGAWPE